MKLNLSFEQNQQNINVPFAESGGQFNANFGETSVIHNGQNGATFFPSVSDDGVISWKNDRELPNPNPVNIKGDKGDKGEQGERGLQGIQGIQGERGSDGAKGEKGEKGDKGDTGEAGANGKNGVSVTHSWSGTTLFVTSASGTTSANLKGAKGDKGDKGDTGAAGTNGIDGYTPVKGVDYYTDADKAEIISAVLNGLNTETWIFTLKDGTTVEKAVFINA